MAMKHPRRRVFPIISSLQYRFLVMTLVYSFILVCFFGLAIFGPDILRMRDPSLGLEARSMAASRVLSMHTWVWPAVLSLIILLALHSFRAFFRVIGPLYRFRWAFEELGKGHMLLRVHTRKRDYLRTEEEAFNNMLQVLNGKLARVRKTTDGALKSLGALEEALHPGNECTEKQADLLSAHREHLESLAAAVHFFRLENDQQE